MLTMDYKEIWNEICFHVRKNHRATEDVFQSVIESMFGKLGWSAYRGELVSQKKVGIGSASNLRTDIIINVNGKELLVVELKRPSENLTERNADQLISYMRFGKLTFGILLGRTLQMFYDKPDSENQPVKICDIQFIDDSDIGIECIELLSKQGLSFDRLQDFCVKCLYNPDKYIEKTDSPLNSDNSTFGGASRGWAGKAKYGEQHLGRDIYNILRQSNDELWIGKKRIEEKLDKMSKHEIDAELFFLNKEPSRIKSSWIAGERFVQIYENK